MSNTSDSSRPRGPGLPSDVLMATDHFRDTGWQMEIRCVAHPRDGEPERWSLARKTFVEAVAEGLDGQKELKAKCWRECHHICPTGYCDIENHHQCDLTCSYWCDAIVDMHDPACKNDRACDCLMLAIGIDPSSVMPYLRRPAEPLDRLDRWLTPCRAEVRVSHTDGTSFIVDTAAQMLTTPEVKRALKSWKAHERKRAREHFELRRAFYIADRLAEGATMSEIANDHKNGRVSYQGAHSRQGIRKIASKYLLFYPTRPAAQTPIT